MKKLITAALASLVLVASMAPAFAVASPDNCAFKDASLCQNWTDSLSQSNED